MVSVGMAGRMGKCRYDVHVISHSLLDCIAVHGVSLWNCSVGAIFFALGLTVCDGALSAENLWQHKT